MKVLVEGCLEIVLERRWSCLGNQQRAADSKLKQDVLQSSFDFSDC